VGYGFLNLVLESILGVQPSFLTAKLDVFWCSHGFMPILWNKKLKLE